jgi:N-carbamoyl-L-amino-acid hydrolase
MKSVAAANVSESRLWERLMWMAQHGRTAAGGVNRQALSPEEFAAWRDLISWGRALGLVPFTDSIGNLFLRLEGADPEAPPVLTGSHLDSQPTGGRFDGVYGVLAGLEAIQAIIESGIKVRHPVEVVAWMNEEGSRFAPGMMGSSAFAGAADRQAFLGVRDAGGVSVADGLAAARATFPELPERPLRRPLAAYIEAHIEQGPILEREKVTIGAVSGIQGKRTFRVNVRGEEGHAGTLPHRDRKDALLAAVTMIHALAAAMHDPEDRVRFTVGKLDVVPNAPSVIAGAATFSVDLRHPDTEVLKTSGDRVSAICAAHAGPCEVTTTELTNAASLEFPIDIRQLITRSAEQLGLSSMDIYSAAGHDARYLHTICPTGMIFVPCRDGVSHNEAESAEPADIVAGTRVLTEVIVELARPMA